MNLVWSGALALAVLGTAGDEKGKPPGSPAERLAALQKQQKEATEAYNAATKELAGKPDAAKKRRELSSEYQKGQTERWTAAIELAKADPASETAYTALELVLSNPAAMFQPIAKDALELLVKHHAANPKIGKVVAVLGTFRPHDAEGAAAAAALIKAVAAKNPDRSARGQAVLAEALDAKQKFSAAERRGGGDVDALAAAAEQTLDKVVKEYGDVVRPGRGGDTKLGDLAGKELFELRNLRIGKVAPDIEGEDLDGKKFKLSDYRGKVVVLDFWGDW